MLGYLAGWPVVAESPEDTKVNMMDEEGNFKILLRESKGDLIHLPDYGVKDSFLR